ncbi:hypothetical protein HDU67_007945 [Dinochytrium kinnereticum]|nr:hypothetical protein HDU67_007945 [Dinochytrium kinnereticum]
MKSLVYKTEVVSFNILHSALPLHYSAQQVKVMKTALFTFGFALCSLLTVHTSNGIPIEAATSVAAASPVSIPTPADNLSLNDINEAQAKKPLPPLPMKKPTPPVKKNGLSINIAAVEGVSAAPMSSPAPQAASAPLAVMAATLNQEVSSDGAEAAAPVKKPLPPLPAPKKPLPPPAPKKPLPLPAPKKPLPLPAPKKPLPPPAPKKPLPLPAPKKPLPPPAPKKVTPVPVKKAPQKKHHSKNYDDYKDDDKIRIRIGSRRRFKKGHDDFDDGGFGRVLLGDGKGFDSFVGFGSDDILGGDGKGDDFFGSDNGDDFFGGNDKGLGGSDDFGTFDAKAAAIKT